MRNVLLDKSQLFGLLRCPACKSSEIIFRDIELICSACTSCFPITENRPILLRNDNALFSIGDYLKKVPKKETELVGWSRYVPSPSVNLSGDRVLKKLRSMLDANGTSNILVVGGGRQRVWLDPLLQAVHSHCVIYSDIDSGADVNLFCDGHDLPFCDGSFDAVVTTAVLEHVLSPERVAGEIGRVLKTGGLLYSEMPFMQQVHEGAYDFTRFTLSGHRRLFNQFAELDAGLVAGPATALVWALENFVLAFSSRPTIRKVLKAGIRFGFSWIKYFDYVLKDRHEAMDGASCTYFMGAKANMRVTDAEIIASYVGAKHLFHA